MNGESGRRTQGSLEVVTGCMFSGKSESLLSRLEEAGGAGLTTAAFKHSSDNRYDHREIVSHNGRRLEAVAIRDASQLVELSGQADLVVIDEGQFFDADLVEACRELRSRGTQVVVAGLDLDSWGLPFGPMPELVQAANRVVHLEAVCACCGKPADHTQRLAAIAGQKMVGGSDCYEPRCAACFRAPPIEMRC